MADTNKLRPEVREAVEVMDARVSHATWQPIRAELLRLADENARMRGIIETLDMIGQHRADRAEAELAALKARIFQGIVLDVDDLARGHAGLPSECPCIRVCGPWRGTSRWQ